MNTVKSFFKIFSLVSAMLFFPLQSEAQFELNRLHLVLDWQVGAPVSTDFADRLSCYGGNFELDYCVTSHCEAGLFLNFQTNHTYVPRQTISLSPTESFHSDQQRSAFQLPFGAAFNYIFLSEGHFRPYVGIKVGTAFSRYTTYYGVNEISDDGWGFYVGPEVGIRLFPNKYGRLGFHIAGYYNYATNHTVTLTHEVEGQSNVGFRVGICF